MSELYCMSFEFILALLASDSLCCHRPEEEPGY